MTAIVIRADAARLPLPDDSVDLIVTSPPYFALRSYQDGGGHYAGQIGSEPTPQEFLEALWTCTAEWIRVLKPSGSIFVNLGDKYIGSATGALGASGSKTAYARDGYRSTTQFGKSKSLMLLPERYRIGCVDRLGLIARAVIIWDKPNGLPESVTDRVRRSHEDWVHLTLQPRYYSAVDEIREPYSPNQPWGQRTKGKSMNGGAASGGPSAIVMEQNSLGKLPGSVWTIPSEPLDTPDYLVEQDGRLVQWIENDRAAWEWMRRTGVDRSPLSRGTGRTLIVAPDHFAAFPTESPRRIISAFAPRGECIECGFLLGSSYDNGMLGVRRPNNSGTRHRAQRKGPGVEGEPLLQQGVFVQEHRQEPQDDEIPAPDDAGLRGGLEAGPPDGAEVGLPDGASSGHGRALGSHAGQVRSGAPQERDQDGQPDREPGTDWEAGTRPFAQATAEAVRLPALRRNDAVVREPLACPHCGSDRIKPGVVGDFFGGTGTTALCASVLGRIGITVDLSHDYGRLARWRTQDAGQRARAMRVEKPPVQLDGQQDLFGGAA